MELVDGKKIAVEILEFVRERIETLSFSPSLAVLLVGNDKASQLYVNLKEEEAKKVGIDFHLYKMDSNVTDEMIIELINFLNSDKEIDGILVQLPLPEHIDRDKVIASIDENKDVDGFKKENIEKFIDGDENVICPVFPKALMTLAESTTDNLTTKKAVIIGKSDIFVQALVATGARIGLDVVEVSCNRIETNKDIVASADIIFIACGIPNMLSSDLIKENVIIIDGGISVVDKKTVGDVNANEVGKKASFLTPVPGGVGPVTVACLLENLVELAMFNNENTVILPQKSCGSVCKIGEIK